VFDNFTVLIKGAGDLATGVAVRLWRAGFPVAMTELECPLAIRRTVAFAEAVYAGEATVENVTARRVSDSSLVTAAWDSLAIPIIVDPDAKSVAALKPAVLVDAILAKKNLGTRMDDAALVIALGPGFAAGVDAHAVVETNRGHYLGRVLWAGSAQPNTGMPGDVNGIRCARVVYAPAEGEFADGRKIGTILKAGEQIGSVAGRPVLAPIAGVLRGLIHDGIPVHPGIKIADVDPRGVSDHCWTVSDKALAVAGGVLEAILVRLKTNG
jgi:xanthine dehydrogenase accessory factor